MFLQKWGGRLSVNPCQGKRKWIILDPTIYNVIWGAILNAKIREFYSSC